MKKLILTVGLPRSGKSTWAKQQGYPIINRDAIRLALHGHPYIPEAEHMVTAIETYMVISLFLAGNEIVIVDATNITAKRRKKWLGVNWNLTMEIFPVPKDICIQRAWTSGREDLIPIIERMDNECDIPEITGREL